MENVRSRVQYKPFGNSMVSLPTGITNLLRSGDIPSQSVAVELNTGKVKYYAGWSGLSTGDSDSFQIDPSFAQAINIRDSLTILISIRTNVPAAHSISAQPLDADDWELVELHAANIQDKIMHQTRCVALDQIMVVYPSLTTTAKLRITSLGDVNGSFALLAPECEISVAPKLRQRQELKTPAVVEELVLPPSHSLRALALPHPAYPTGNEYGCYCIFADISSWPAEVVSDFVLISAINGPNNPASSDTGATGTHTDHVAKPRANDKVIARLVDYREGICGTAGISFELAAALNTQSLIGFHVTVTSAPPRLSRRPGGLFILPYAVGAKSALKINNSDRKANLETIATHLRQMWFQPLASKEACVAITNFAQLSPIPKVLPYGGVLRFAKSSDTHAWFAMSHADNLARPLRMALGEDIGASANAVPRLLEPAASPLSLAIALDKIMENVLLSLTLTPNSGTLIYGQRGCGKTLIAACVGQSAAERGYHVHHVQCESLMNELYTSLSKNHIQKWIQACAWHLPSLLILDNLDKIMAAESENHDSSKATHSAEILVAHLERVRRQSGINVLLLTTSTSRESLSSVLHQCHVLDDIEHLRTPDKQAREQMLSEFMCKRSKCRLDFDVGDLVSESEGYSPNDLRILSDRIFYEASFGCAESSLSISWNHVKEALAGFTPSNLAGVKLEKSTTKWSDVGGLEAAKSILLETLEWPTKYAPIFANSTLRLRLGILLYGHPGCGKTLLASAVAAQCGLNFISIKGPEILNKYIGASEQLVRELFDRAQAAKPCVLFFDEFDSIAPKRGHDSTGVTDRVVNQMLTQMDGAEGLQGVYVLAATSRPDLIDPALLRPGRLDKSVICGMPSRDERLDILRTISAKMDLTPEVSLDEIADNTRGFSGADLQGLCSGAHLKAVHMQLESGKETGIEVPTNGEPQMDFFQIGGAELNTRLEHAHTSRQVQQLSTLSLSTSSTERETPVSSKIWIHHHHFQEALHESKPSILRLEMLKLNAVYGEFASSRDGNMTDGSASNEIGGRVTLM